MGKMIRFELYKVFRKPLLLLLCLGCLALHLGVLWYQEAAPAESVPTEEAAEPERYKAYREEILRQADLRMHSPMFAGMDAYTYDNLKYTKEAYEKLGEISVRPDFDGGVLLLIQNRLADVLCLFLLLTFVLRLFVEERENDTWSLLKAMKRGHTELMAAKLLSLAVLTVGVTALFYGGAVVFIGRTVGFGDLSRSLQSVDGFMACTLRLDVGEFLPLFLLAKTLGFFAVAVVAAIFCMLLRNTVFTVAAVAVSAAAELLCWHNITINSWLAPLKEMNLSALIFTEHYFSEFYHINLATLAVNQQFCGAVLLTACLAGGPLLVCFAHEREVFLALPQGLVKRRVAFHRRKESCPEENENEGKGNDGKADAGIFAPLFVSGRPGKRVLAFEAYKLFCVGKGWCVLLVFGLGCMFLASSFRFYMDESEYYYREYSLKLEGELTAEKEAILEEERKILRELPAEEVSSARENALNQVREQYLRMDELKRQGMPAQYVYLTPWQYLLGRGLSLQDTLNLGLCFLAMILLASSCGAMEKRKEMYDLLSLTVTGRKGIYRRKALWMLLAAAGTFLAAFLPGILQIRDRFGISALSAPAVSYTGTGFWGMSLSLGSLLALKYTGLLACVCAAGLGMLLISEKIRSRIFTVLIGAVALLVPVCLLLL